MLLGNFSKFEYVEGKKNALANFLTREFKTPVKIVQKVRMVQVESELDNKIRNHELDLAIGLLLIPLEIQIIVLEN